MINLGLDYKVHATDIYSCCPMKCSMMTFILAVHQAWAVELPHSIPCDNSTHPGVQRNYGYSAQKIRSTMAQIETRRPAGTHVGWLMATLSVANSVRKEGLEYIPQACFAGYPLASPDSQHRVDGLWGWGAGLGGYEEDTPICKSATTTTTPNSGSLTHLHSEGRGCTRLRSGDSAAPSTQEDESLRARGHHTDSPRSMTDKSLIISA